MNLQAVVAYRHLYVIRKSGDRKLDLDRIFICGDNSCVRFVSIGGTE